MTYNTILLIEKVKKENKELLQAKKLQGMKQRQKKDEIVSKLLNIHKAFFERKAILKANREIFDKNKKVILKMRKSGITIQKIVNCFIKKSCQSDYNYVSNMFKDMNRA